jgi:hypothetical protein
MSREAGSTASLDEVERALFGALADLLIPSADGMPSATEAGVAGKWLDEVLSVRPDFGPALAAAIDAARDADPADALARLRSSDPVGFGVIAEVAAGAYFMNPQVRQAIGYGGQLQVPIVAEDPPDYEQDGLLASVVARGPLYRPTPGRAKDA